MDLAQPVPQRAARIRAIAKPYAIAPPAPGCSCPVCWTCRFANFQFFMSRSKGRRVTHDTTPPTHTMARPLIFAEPRLLVHLSGSASVTALYGKITSYRHTCMAAERSNQTSYEIIPSSTTKIGSETMCRLTRCGVSQTGHNCAITLRVASKSLTEVLLINAACFEKRLQSKRPHCNHTVASIVLLPKFAPRHA